MKRHSSSWKILVSLAIDGPKKTICIWPQWTQSKMWWRWKTKPYKMKSVERQTTKDQNQHQSSTGFGLWVAIENSKNLGLTLTLTLPTISIWTTETFLCGDTLKITCRVLLVTSLILSSCIIGTWSSSTISSNRASIRISLTCIRSPLRQNTYIGRNCINSARRMANFPWSFCSLDVLETYM